MRERVRRNQRFEKGNKSQEPNDPSLLPNFYPSSWSSSHFTLEPPSFPWDFYVFIFSPFLFDLLLSLLFSLTSNRIQPSTLTPVGARSGGRRGLYRRQNSVQNDSSPSNGGMNSPTWNQNTPYFEYVKAFEVNTFCCFLIILINVFICKQNLLFKCCLMFKFFWTVYDICSILNLFIVS